MKSNENIFILIVVAVVVSALASGLNDGGGANMNPDNLEYYPSNAYWTNRGRTLVMEGAFINLSDDYDITQLEDAVIYLTDSAGDIVASVNVNERVVGAIPHKGKSVYNFTVSTIRGGSLYYNAWDLTPTLETKFNYTQCEGRNCRFCGGYMV